MRRIGLTAGVLLALTAAGNAAAVTNVPSVGGSINPTKVGTTERPANTKLSLRVGLDSNPAGLQPNTASKLQLLFPKGLITNGRYFKSCSASTVQSAAASCPAGSKIGTGSAVALAGAPGRPVSESFFTANATVTLFNGPSGKSVILLIEAVTPSVTVAIPASLTGASGAFSKRLTVAFPPNLQEVAGIQVAVTQFRAAVTGTTVRNGRRISYVQTTSCPSTKRMKLRGDFTFNDDNGQPGGGLISSTGSIACRR